MSAAFSRSIFFFFFSSRRRHTRSLCDWSSDVCSSDLLDTIHRDVDDEDGLAITHTGRSTSRLPERSPHSFLKTVSPSGRDHLVLPQNNMRIHAQLQPVAGLTILVEEDLVSGDTARL